MLYVAAQPPYRWRLLAGEYLPLDLATPPVRIPGFVSLDRRGLYVYASYAWDGVTCGPDWRWWLRASLFHDALYQLIREGKMPRRARAWADRVFLRVALEDSPWWARPLAWAAWAVVRVGGWWAVHPRSTAAREQKA